MRDRHLIPLVAATLVGALALAACGTDDNGPAQPAAQSSVTGVTCASGTVNASGSTAQANAIDAWIKAYQQACPDATINYQANGSGAGVQQFLQGSTDFAGSDVPLTADEQATAKQRCSGGEAIDLPMVIGPIAVVYDLPGVTDLRLSPSTIAKIFDGKITAWNDPALAKDNPDAKLPNTPIQAVHRSDDSGTSFNFTSFLAAAAPSDWTIEPAKHWNAHGGQGASGSAALAQIVKATPGAIGYVEYAYALGSSLAMASIANGSGEYVALTAQTASAAVASAPIVGQGNDLALRIDYATDAAGAYPIVLVTYEIVCTKGLPALARSFLSYLASESGQQVLAGPGIGYAPLPGSVADRVRQAIAALA